MTRRRPARHGHGQVRRPDAQPRHEGARPERGHVVHGLDPGRQARGCGRRRPRTSTTSPSPCARTAARSPATELHSGIRSIKVSNGRLFLNGQALNLRGVGVHEEGKGQGFAIDNARRDQMVKDAKELGATVLRSHYPLHPYTHELADRLGLLIWSEIPVYRVRDEVFREPSVRRLAVNELSRNIVANENHPSVMVWSIGNELATRPGPGADGLHRLRVPVGQADGPVTARRLRGRRLSELALPGRAVRADRRARRQRLLRLVPGAERPDLRPHEALRLPRRGPRLLPEPGPDGHRVRRRGQPRRPRRGEGHLGLPAGVGQLPPERVRHQAVAERRAVLDAERVLGAAGLGGRQPAPDLAAAPEGPDQLRRRAQAGVRRRAALVHADPAGRSRAR